MKVTKNCGVPYSTAMADSSLKEVFLLKSPALNVVACNGHFSGPLWS